MQIFKRLKFLIVLIMDLSLADFIQNIDGEVVGELKYVIADKNQHLIDIAEKNSIGVDAIIEANPDLSNKKLNKGRQILLPTSYILPHVKKGIVINLPEKRLYYFTGKSVHIYPVGIGRVKHDSSVGFFSITEKRHKPSWRVPKSVLQEEHSKGNVIPDFFAPGPDNPLGDYAMRLSNSSILIHSTNFPPSIGKRSTSGCFSMYPRDAEELFNMVKIGTQVAVIDVPIKSAFFQGKLYLESHHALKDTNNHGFNNVPLKDIEYHTELFKSKYPFISRLAFEEVFSENMGVPIAVEDYHGDQIPFSRSSYR